MVLIKTFDSENKPTEKEKEQLIDFLYKHLEQYGDPRADIEKCADYALKERPSFGGFILTSHAENDELTGVVIVNETGMLDYIPENILVYIATHNKFRGQGIGKALMNKASETAKGNIALHVEPDNPARHLYEKVGYTSKYIEMRLIK